MNKMTNPQRLSIILWTVNLSSIAASVFSYVYLSYFVYSRTGNVLLSEWVLLAPMVMPIVLCLVIGRIANKTVPRRMLLLCNVVCLGCALLCYGLLEQHIWLAFLAALVIGFLDALQRVARTIAIKRYFSSADVKYAVPITLTAQFIAGGVAGVALAFYRSEITTMVANIIVSTGFLLAILAARLLPIESMTSGNVNLVQQQNQLARLWSLLSDNVNLRRHFFAFLIFVSIFQGFFNVSRITLPTHVLKLSQSWVGYLQIISASSALAGALLFVWLVKRKIVLNRPISVVLSGVALLAMGAASSLTQPLINYFLYFVFMLIWELLFFKYQADLVTVTPQEDMAQVATFQYAGVYLGMLITGTLGGILTEKIGLAACSGIFALLYLILMPLNALHGKQTADQAASTG
ncbi:MFS transporter [Verminephrobacter eiseniae]|uniref:MFS transporter n=1 Tax=Verminephrobacter eiseniae TaxID=364317 RepID=UPI0022380A5B|nr:MFS transporter [Verminephrobacter eiseniae]MCW5236645.1 MFS transporter [Verminephrobacter eiseniae]